MYKKIFSIIAATALVVSFSSCADDFDGKSYNENGEAIINAAEHLQAFPGAEGGGNAVLGGAGGQVYTVTSLEDPADYIKEGTLRWAIMQTGVRTIVFNVSGNIKLTSPLDITKNYITIAGQTAPEGGITVSGYPVTIKASNVILRYLRFRLGSANIEEDNFVAEDGDALGAKDVQDVIIDHCSMSWSTDECASFSRVKNFTLQYCIISESLKLAGHSKGRHGYGGIWGGENASYHHNLIADHDSRNPRFDHEYVGGICRGPIDYVNNVVYNWGGNSTYGGEVKTGSTPQFAVNMENNYYKPGNSSSHKERLLELTVKCENCKISDPGKYFINGNVIEGSSKADWDAVEIGKKDSKDKRTDEDILGYAMCGIKNVDGLKLLDNVETAEDAYKSVLAYAGASYDRDAVDERIINEVINNTGKIIDKESDVQGLPEIESKTRPAGYDTDGDGMPDEWEIANGLNPNNDRDGRQCILNKNYTNLEVYLNSLVDNLYVKNGSHDLPPVPSVNAIAGKWMECDANGQAVAAPMYITFEGSNYQGNGISVKTGVSVDNISYSATSKILTISKGDMTESFTIARPNENMLTLTRGEVTTYFTKAPADNIINLVGKTWKTTIDGKVYTFTFFNTTTGSLDIDGKENDFTYLYHYGTLVINDGAQTTPIVVKGTTDAPVFVINGTSYNMVKPQVETDNTSFVFSSAFSTTDTKGPWNDSKNIFTLACYDPGSKMKCDGDKSVTIGEKSFSYQFTTGGKSDSKQYLTITLTKNAKLTFYVKSGSKDVTRSISLKETSFSASFTQDVADGFTTDLLPAGTYTINFPDGAIYIYGIDCEYEK